MLGARHVLAGRPVDERIGEPASGDEVVGLLVVPERVAAVGREVGHRREGPQADAERHDGDAGEPGGEALSDQGAGRRDDVVGCPALGVGDLVGGIDGVGLGHEAGTVATSSTD